MQQWKKKKGLMRQARYAVVFEPMEREVLGDLSAAVSEALIQRAQSVPKDPLAEMTGMTSGHKEAPTDPALARLLPDFQHEGDEEYDGDNSFLRSLHEGDITRAKLENLRVINDALGPTEMLRSPPLRRKRTLGWLRSMTSACTLPPVMYAAGKPPRKTAKTSCSGLPTIKSPCWKR